MESSARLLSIYVMFVVTESLSPVQPFVTPRTAARQAPLPSAFSWNSLKCMPLEPVLLSSQIEPVKFVEICVSRLHSIYIISF